MLAELGAAATPAELGVTPARLRADLLAARQIRRRYTALDLAAETGLLEPCIDAVIAALPWDRGHPGRLVPGRAPRAVR
jgi:glycerol-1-phosphate dehydrogenase [NAD(P)+]